MIDEKKLIEIVNTDEWKYRLIRNPTSIQEALSETIESIPRVGEWIPCSERLPEKEGSYLLTSKTVSGIRYVRPGMLYSNGKFGSDSVIAWMPLPEPYKEDKE